ncbi:Protein of unknown function [Cotesia congregata]|nr:Protein of unknown function [Cotesia congregata]
MNIFNI